MGETKRWMISTKLKAQDNYKNKIKINDTVFVTAVIQVNTEQSALQQLCLMLKTLKFEIVTVLSTALYSNDVLNNLALCERYAVEEAANSIEVGLNNIAFGVFMTEEYVKHQSRVWFAYTQSLPMFEGPLVTDGSEVFIDCLLVAAATKEYAQAQINETLFLQGQEKISLLLKEIDQESEHGVVDLECILSSVDNSNLHVIIENNINDALTQAIETRKVTSVCNLIANQ